MSRHVALVEDEPAIRENYSEALRKQGYTVSSYPNKSDAIKAFKQRLPDLVIIDIALGDDAEGGFDLCRHLRGSSSALPIIFLTAKDSDFDVISGLRQRQNRLPPGVEGRREAVDQDHGGPASRFDIADVGALDVHVPRHQ